jgi:hypothetical protein
MSGGQDVGRSHNIETDKSLKKVEQFRYLVNNINESKLYSGRN